MPRYKRIPPRRPVPWSRTLRLWASLSAALLVLLLAVVWSERLPEPLPSSSPASDFSSARAWPALAFLADTVGLRLPGSTESARSREYLLARLRALPGLEVVEQDALGMRVTGSNAVTYRVRNVLARLPGREAGSVLLSSHYDSPASSVGAADDAIAVAAMLEVARALTAGPAPMHSVIFNFDDAEEQGLLGASGFLRHPWASDVRAFVDLESAGNAGKAVLFQAGPDNAWLTSRYASSVPHPYGTVLGQDIFQSGLIPSGTDFEIYSRMGGMRGLDIAFYRGGWAYHTPLDRVAAVEPGSVQHMGANTLALTRALAAGPLPGDIGGSASVYYDILGWRMVTYPQTAASWLAVAAIVLLVIGIRALMGGRLLRGRTLRGALVVTVVGIVLAFIAAIAGAALTAYVMRRPHGWFAHPWRGVWAFGSLSLLPILAVQWRFAQRPAARDEAPEARVMAAWVAAFIVAAAFLLALTVAGIGSAYLLLWWVVGGAASLAVLAFTGGRHWPVAACLGLLPGALLTLQTGFLAIELFAPIAGRFPADFPFDFVIAVIVATVVVLVGPPTTALLHRHGRLGAASLAVGGSAVVALMVLWLSFPYSATRPQRLMVVHETFARGGRLTLTAGDMLGPRRAARFAESIAGSPTATEGTDDEIHFAAGIPPVAAPQLELLGEQRTAAGERTLVLRLRPDGAYRTVLELPPERPGRWSVAGVSPDAETVNVSRMRFISAPDSGWIVTVTVPEARPLAIDVHAVHAVTTPAARALMERLPPWSAAYAEAVARRRVIF